MLKDEFNRLMEIFREGAEGKKIDLNELFSKSLALFEEFKKELQTGTPEDQRDAMRMMMEMYKEIKKETQQIITRSGLTEEQLTGLAENPGNFSAEQWKAIQESKQKIQQAGKDLLKAVQHIPAPSGVGKEKGQGQGQGQGHGQGPIHQASILKTGAQPSHKKHRKSDWKRS